jgi:hypothetical protein
MSSAVGYGPGTAIKYLRQTASSVAGSDLGATIKYLRYSRGQRPGRHDEVPATHYPWGCDLVYKNPSLIHDFFTGD